MFESCTRFLKGPMHYHVLQKAVCYQKFPNSVIRYLLQVESGNFSYIFQSRCVLAFPNCVHFCRKSIYLSVLNSEPFSIDKSQYFPMQRFLKKLFVKHISKKKMFHFNNLEFIFVLSLNCQQKYCNV